MKYKCLLSYDGYSYLGYQKQKHDKNTIQEKVEQALSYVFKEKITIYASGRTDKKVHALGQCFHFESEKVIPFSNLKKALNELLPNDIAITSISKASDSFHARFSVKRKIYLYKIKTNKNKNVFDNRYFAYEKRTLDESLLKKAASLFIGTYDFKNFTTNTKDEVESFIKTIYDVKVKILKKQINLEFVGSGFLRYQIRMMVGAILEVSCGKKDLNFITHLLNEKVSEKCSYKAKPEGLYLKKVIY